MKTTPINHTGGGYKPEPYKKVRNKIKKAKTDTKSFPANEKDLNKRPEIQNLIGIYSSLKSQKITDT